MLAALALPLPASAVPQQLGGTLQVVTIPTNSAVASALQYNPTLQQFTISHGALTSTNEMQVNIYGNTTGTTNGSLIGVWYPSYTNATTEIIPANTFALTNYVWLQVSGTNTISWSGTYGQ